MTTYIFCRSKAAYPLVIGAIPEPTTAPLIFAAASLCLTRRFRSSRRIRPLMETMHDPINPNGAIGVRSDV
jgi:hypothetical protein